MQATVHNCPSTCKSLLPFIWLMVPNFLFQGDVSHRKRNHACLLRPHPAWRLRRQAGPSGLPRSRAVPHTDNWWPVFRGNTGEVPGTVQRDSTRNPDPATSTKDSEAPDSVCDQRPNEVMPQDSERHRQVAHQERPEGLSRSQADRIWHETRVIVNVGWNISAWGIIRLQEVIGGYCLKCQNDFWRLIPPFNLHLAFAWWLQSNTERSIDYTMIEVSGNTRVPL